MNLIIDPQRKSSEQPKLAARLWDKMTRVFPAALLLVYLAQFSAFMIAIGGFEPYVRLMDFMPTIAAAQLIVDGRGTSLYDLNAQHEAEVRVLYPYKSLDVGELLPYNHLPFEAFIIIPFMSLSYVMVALYWTIILLVAVAAALVIVMRTLPIKLPWLLASFALSYPPVFRAFVLGQNSVLILLGICSAFAASRYKGARWDACIGAGMVLVALKPQILPLVLLVLFLEGRWKALLWFGSGLVTLTLLAMPLLGPTWPWQYLMLLLSLSQWNANAAINPEIMHNWRGFVTDTIGTLFPSSTGVIVIVLTAFSILLFLYAWWNNYRNEQKNIVMPLGANQESNKEFASELLWGLAVITAILISPHLNPHDLTLLIFPGWIMVHIVQQSILSQKLKSIWMCLLESLYVIMLLEFFVQGTSTLWVISDVLLLMCSTWLLVITIRTIHGGSLAEASTAGGFDRVTAKD